MASSKTSLNYAFWMTSRAWRDYHWPEVLFCDEAHALSDVVLRFVGCTIDESSRARWDLPEFPTIRRSDSPLTGKTLPAGAGTTWLEPALAKMSAHFQHLRSQKKPDGRALAHCNRTATRIRTALLALQTHPQDWYVVSGPDLLYRKGEKVSGFVAKPFTARYHAPRYFTSTKGRAVILMSATIGNPETFAVELGLRNWSFREVPNQWLPEQRQVQLLDVPTFNHKSPEKDFEYQADAVAQAIKSCPPFWSGLLLVTRKSEAKLLAQRLSDRGLGSRVWVTPGVDDPVPTDQQVTAWKKRCRKKPNSLCISWSFWMGYDGLDERICIVTKVPFGDLSEAYEKERLSFYPDLYHQRAAQMLEQGAGRTRRGREQDYDIGERRGLVCIADGNWQKVERFFSQSFRDSLIEFEPD